MAPERSTEDSDYTLRDPEHLESELPPEESEDAPLLSREDRAEDEHDDRSQPQSSAVSSLLRCIRNPDAKKRSCLKRWPSLLALAVLCIAAIIIIVLGFVIPQVAKEYAQQAATFEPKRLSIDSYTDTGVVARAQGTFYMDASKVEKKPVRDLGRFGMWIARSAEIGDTDVTVSLPRHGDVVLGTAKVPSMTFGLRNQWHNDIDVLVHLEPGPRDDLRQIAKEFVDGRFDDYFVKATADVPLRSGIIRLGRQFIEQTFSFDGDQVPTMPSYKIKKLNFRDLDTVSTSNGIAADVSILLGNEYPVDVTIPSLGFSVGVDNCRPSDPHIKLADATTGALHVKPDTDLLVNVTGFVRHLPEAFTTACPGSVDSPFDTLLGNYINGKEAMVYVSGTDSPSKDTPKWISELAYGVTVPIPVPGRSLGSLIKNFTMNDVHFSLPDIFAEPDTPEAQPRISAQVKALIALPDEMNFHVDVDRIRSTADVFYRKKKLGVLDISKWHKAQSEEIREPGETHPDLLITSNIENAPLKITDGDVFNEVVSALLTGSKELHLTVKALVDVEMETPLGALAVRQIPAQGDVPVKPIGGSSSRSFAPTFNDLRIVKTSAESLTLHASLNFTNPTNYTAVVPYADVNILVNGTVIGHALIKNVSVKQGNNSNVPIEAIWEPSKSNGTHSAAIGREFLSQYISGYNTTLAFRPYKGTIPAQPALGKALESLEIELPTPKLGVRPSPGDGDGDGHGDGKGDDQPHFIKQATFHLVSSTANFILASPLTHTTIDITSIDATAFYHNDTVGKIDYEGDLEVPPGESETPKLPVDWSLDSLGYEAIKKALGGTLKLKAFAWVGIRIGQFEDRIWYRGRSIGAHVRL